MDTSNTDNLDTDSPDPSIEDRDDYVAPEARVLNCDPSLNQDNDWTIEDAVQAGAIAVPNSSDAAGDAATPANVDYRRNWWRIGNQGDTGSCVGWATEAMLRWHLVAQGVRPRVNATRQLSPRHIWMASKETDQYTTHATTFVEKEGTSLKSALDVVRKRGSVPESDIPFWNGRNWTGSLGSFLVKAAQNRLGFYINLGPFNMANWLWWIRTYGPILTRLDVDDSFLNVGGNGNIDLRSTTTHDGHAVCIVGYRDGRFILRNSWGTGWGDSGFAYVNAATYAPAAFTESYGVFGPPTTQWSKDMSGVTVSRDSNMIHIAVPLDA